jgi:two-component system, NtrC family, sensor kinase
MEKILVVDDERAFRAMVVTVLRRQGYEVYDAGDVSEGLALAFAQRPGLILSDLNLAGGNGFDLLKELRSHPETSAIPVIVMTGGQQHVSPRSSMDRGADDYLQKPFGTETLLASVHARLQRQSSINRAMEAQRRAERVGAEEKLRLQTTALEAAANGIGITDLGGRVLWVNPAFTKLTGFESDEIIGRTFAVLKSGRHQPEFYRNIWETILAGNVWHGELVNQRKDGGCYLEEMTITPVRGADGNIQNFIAIKQDVSERKRAEEALRRSQQEFKDMFDNAPVGFHEIDAEGRLVRINNTELKMLGYSPGELLGQFVWKISAEEEISHQAALAKLNGEPPPGGSFERKFRRKDGSILPVLISDRILKREDGAITGIRTSIQDITAEKEIEQALARERDLLQALMDNQPDFIYFKDADSRFTRINRALARHFGLQKPEDAIGKSDANFFSPMEARQKLVDEQCLLATGNPILGLVEKSDTAGETRWVSSTKVPICGPDGAITGLVGISRDITASKQAELERQRMELQLRQAQKLESIGQLAAGIAHEINTPMQYVGDNTRFVKDSFTAISRVLACHQELLAAAKAGAVTPELLARCAEILPPDDLAYYCEQIPVAIGQTLEGVERVSKIVRAMKEFSHPGGKEKSSADLNQAIESTVTVARNEWKYVADMELELEPKLPPVPCFLGEFNQCILNLVVNAAHAIGDVVKKNPGTKGRITVQTARDGDHVAVRVTDTGTGIAEANRSKVFEPFFTTKDVGRGTGQGLAMVYGSVVNRHGGTVTFETELGRGTTFIIRLPLKSKTGPETAGPRLTEISAHENALVRG